MDKKYLIINRGSASEKYAVYSAGQPEAFLHLERSTDEKDYVSTFVYGDKKEVLNITKKDFENSLLYCLQTFKATGIIKTNLDISAVGIRVVAPGTALQADQIITSQYEKNLKKVLPDAPLHLLPTYEMILQLRKLFRNTPIVGISDSDFHQTIPAQAYTYPLPAKDAEKLQLRKYGYHGISVESVLYKLQMGGKPLPGRVIVCHIGSGVSVTAVKDGKSIENSMGYTPLEGAMMATRGGDLDPGVVAIISYELGLRGTKLKNYLNKKCGLLGVSGHSSDVRDLIQLEQSGNAPAKLALDMYAYKLQKIIGSYYTVLGGLDQLVFTATVGERSFIMRERICAGLTVLGVKINTEINNQTEGVDADISAVDSTVKVSVLKTDEMGQMARDTVKVLEA